MESGSKSPATECNQKPNRVGDAALGAHDGKVNTIKEIKALKNSATTNGITLSEMVNENVTAVQPLGEPPPDDLGATSSAEQEPSLIPDSVPSAEAFLSALNTLRVRMKAWARGEFEDSELQKEASQAATPIEEAEFKREMEVSLDSLEIAILKEEGGKEDKEGKEEKNPVKNQGDDENAA